MAAAAPASEVALETEEVRALVTVLHLKEKIIKLLLTKKHAVHSPT